MLSAAAGFAQTQTNNSASQDDSSTQTSSSSQSSSQSDKSQKDTDKNKERELEKKEQSQRMLGVVPQFGVTSRKDAPPLTSGEKFHLFTKSAFDPVEFGLVGLQAGISQAEDEFPEYGQGAAGYGKRYGAAFADEVSSGFFSNYFYPVLLKEDPRYFRLGQGSVMHRIEYSVAQEFICRTDSGNRSFGWSNTLGAFTAGGISNIYYPQSDRGFGLTMSRAGIAMLYGSLGGLADEFYPDIDRKFIHRHPKQNPQ
ncbi:MAG TPA: hypothetical protein VFX22_03970 [Candidatus Kapabacteria bacterium]|nr:hypothetical protein [Candidatus Kapabacteria bacterium]